MIDHSSIYMKKHLHVQLFLSYLMIIFYVVKNCVR